MSIASQDTGASGRRIVISPGVSFTELSGRLESLGWERRPDTLALPPILAGEPELAQWRRHDGAAILTYTFNPVVHLRTLHVVGDAAETHAEAIASRCATVRAADIPRALGATEPREQLRGILTAAALEAYELAGSIGLLAAHHEKAVAETAARVHLDLLHVAATAFAGTDRLPELAGILDAICGNALPLLATLPGLPADDLLGLQPTEEDCREVLAGDVAAGVAAVYDDLFATSPAIDPGPDRRELRVRACPSGLFASDNPFSHAFPGGYRKVASYLRPGRVWLAWRYCAPGSQSGYALDGLIHVRGNWVWFPKVYDAIGRQPAAGGGQRVRNS